MTTRRTITVHIHLEDEAPEIELAAVFHVARHVEQQRLVIPRSAIGGPRGPSHPHELRDRTNDDWREHTRAA